MASDSIGDRMKGQYENRTRYMLPRRTYTIIRVDGKAFHSFTRHCDKPNDRQLAEALDNAAIALCTESQGCVFGYVQSDEISILLMDFSTITTEAWFDGNLQKICSVSASTVTEAFAREYRARCGAIFDTRVFTIPDPIEVENYFIWRQQDATRNSIQGLAQARFSHKEMFGKNTTELQEMLYQRHGINWSDTPSYWKRGRCIVKDAAGWHVDSEVPVFTQDREYLSLRIARSPTPQFANAVAGTVD